MPEVFDLTIFLKNLPNLPGVYRMLDKKGKVLYVGKARSLKNRVRSYFQKNDHSPRITLMIKQISKIEITVTRSEVEALILENNFIKSLTPKYNVLFRDDKTYPYLKFSNHPYAQISYFRGNLDKKNYFFGPYPNSHAVRESIQTLQKLFLLRTCEESVFLHRHRPCLLYQIKRCSAPCMSLISPDTYQQNVQQALDFLQGKTSQLSKQLKKQMHEAAHHLAFEEAARLRDQLQYLNQLQAQQFIDSKKRSVNADILAIIIQGTLICLHWVNIRSGRHIGDQNFFVENTSNHPIAPIEYAEAFMAQHYLNQSKPDILITNFKISELLQQALIEDNQHKIQFITQPQGERKVWLKMAVRNAEIAIANKLLQTSNQQDRQNALAQLLQLPEIKRIECFDISHTFGEATVASCVVYDNNTIQPQQYRRFNIQSTESGDDYAAMKEVLIRRYTKLAQNHTDADPCPDLVVIDGGKGQISIALQVFADLGLDIPLIGIAKGPERKAGLEELIIPHLNKELHLAENHSALHLLQTVRDEAHRFAITGHRKKREKNRMHSTLDDITGIGSKRKKNLLLHFGGMRQITAAGIEELAQVDGISLALAERIYQQLH